MHDDCIARGCKPQGKEKEMTFCQQGSCNKLNVYDWMYDIPETITSQDIIEIRFKNTRKGFYQNTNKLRLKTGDIVAVESNPGHDIGVVSLTGELVKEQLDHYDIEPEETEFKKIYRKAKQTDIEKWIKAIELEHKTMIKSRQIAADLGLDMKIGDVEYQGDITKAIFYYIADDRVDFRELIKILADQFRIRVEMKQIGARQEAGRIGGIGSCGRELCCATWISDFVSVTTNSARMQELSLNPQKLAGQCGKLKCCLNYELPCYIEAQRDFPNKSILLETREGSARHFKTDVYRRILWYVYTNENNNLYAMSVERVNEIIAMNKKGKKPEKLADQAISATSFEDLDYQNVVGQESLTRFEDKDVPRKKKKKKRNQRKRNFNQNNNRPKPKPRPKPNKK